VISTIQIALAGLAPPILAVHVALSGLAPVEQQQVSAGGPVREELRIKEPKKQKPRAIQRAPRPQERPQIQTEPIRPPQAVPAQTFTARAPIALPLAAVAVALGLPDVPTKAAHPAPQSTRDAFPLTATAIAAARIVAEMVAQEAAEQAQAERQAAAERRRHNNRAAILVALLLSQQ
jgi:hypothetical protein